MATPTLDEFLGAARTANPGVPDDALKSYWTQAYGQADPATLPTLDTWFAKAKETNPSVPDYALRDYWREEYGSRGALERELEQPGVLGTLAEGFRQTGRSLEATGRAVLDDRAGVEAIAARPRVQDPALKAFYQAIEDGKPVDPSWLDTLGSVGKAIGQQPKGAALSAVEQLPNMGVSMGSMAAGAAGGLALGGPVGAIVGGIAGMFGADIALETGQKVLERAQDGSFTPEDRALSLTEGPKKGAVVGAIDTLSLGVTKWITGVTARAVERATQRALVDAGVDTADTAAVLAAKQNPAIVEAVQAAQQRAIAATSTIPTRLAQGTSALALESVGEGVGEYLGEYAATGEGNKVEAVLEALTSLGQSSVEIAGTRALNKAQQRAAMFAKPDVAAVPQHVGVGDQSVSVDDAIARAASMVDEATPDVLDAAISTEAQDRARTGQGGYEIPSAVEQADQAERLAAIRAERLRLGLPIAEDITQQEKRPAIEPAMLPDAEPTAVPLIEQPVVATKPPVPLDEQPSVIEQERARIVAERAQTQPQDQIEPSPTRTPARAADAPLVSTSSIASAPSAEELQVLASLRGQELPDLTTLGWHERQQIADVLKDLPLVSSDKMPRVPESQAVEISRGELPPTQNAELLARAEKAQADMDIAGDERGGYKSATADWYKEATTGERALSRDRVETALRKIIQDNGLDTGKDVLRIKQLLLEDREFERSPFAPQNEVEWIRLISRALMPQSTTEKTAASVAPEAPRTVVADERVRLQAEREASLRGPLDSTQGVRTTGLPARMPYVWSTRDHAAVKAHEDYRAAKSGDMHAAIRLVRDMVNPRTVEEAANRFPGAKFVAPYTLDEDGANMIPRALAAHYANAAKGSVAGDIVQVTRAGRTAADPMERMLKRPQFAGHVAKGGQYVLVDDVVTMGGTLAELSNYIHSQGGTALGAVSLTNATRTGTLDVSPLRQELLRGRFGPTIKDLFGVEPHALTGPEAGYLGNFRSSDALRARADAARVPRGERDTPGRLSVGADRRLATDTGAPTEPAETSLTEPAETPLTDPAETPLTDPAETPLTEPAETPLTEPAETPLTEPAETPLTEPVEKSPTAIIAQALRQAADQIAKSGDVPRVAEPTEVHAMTITEPMRRSVLTEGQALFENTTTYALRDGEDPQRNRELASSALSALARAGDGVSATSGAVDRVGRYDGSIKTVALGISPDLKSGRAVSLTGYRVTSARDLAMLAEVYRDPQVETLRFFYVKGEQIVGHEGVSSRLPASVKVFVGPDGKPMDADAFFAQQAAKMRAFGADGYWILHNHPSGRSAPSREDHRLTTSLSRGINGFRGHIVIDTGEYSTIEIDADGDLREATHTLDTSKTDAMLAPSVQHPHLGTYIRGSQDIASVAKSLQTPAAYASVIYRASNGVVRAIQEVPVELFKDVQGAKDYFQRTTVAFGSPEVFAYHEDDSIVTPSVHQLIRMGVLRDFVTPRQNAYIAPLSDMVMGRPFSAIPSEWVSDQRAAYNEQPDYSVPGVTALDSVIRTMQDEFIDVRRLVDAVKSAKGQVADALNPTLKEELYQGRAAKAVQDFLTDELDPLVKQMQLNRISLEDFDRYLYARHAKEANAYLLGINLDREDNDALSGMTNAEAETILQEAKPVMAKIATRVDAIIAENRRMLVEYGLESSQTVAQWAEQYRHYVPLMREGFEEDGGGTGSGRSVRSSGVKARLGSTRRATNILANVALQRERTISRGEKQKPVVALAGLLATHPNAEIAALVKPVPMTYIDDAGMLQTVPGDTGPYTVPTIRYVDPRTGQVSRRPDPNYKGRDNVVNFRVKGQDYAIVFNEDNERAVQMARSLKSLDTTALNIFARAFAPVTRYISSINTQYNPLFGIRNFIRDIGFASISLSSTPLSGSRSKIVRRTMGNLRGIYQDARAVRRGEHPGSRVAKLWEEFQRTGGQTGYRDLFKGSTDRADAIQAMLDPASWTKTTLGKFATLGGVLAKPEQFMVSTIGKPLFNWLSDYNLTMENAVRLAVFEVAREQGISSEQSASLAKNITVNFNRKGRITSQMGSLYGFFNASVQGTARVVETMFVPGKVGVLTTVGKRIVAGGMLLGAMQALALALAGYDDEEPPEWQKQRSVIVPLFNEKKTYLSFPMPLGFNVIPSLGRLLVEAMVHGNPGRKAWDFAAAMIDTFSPIGGTSSPLQLVTPSALDPVAALYENKDWTGRTIYKENRDSLKPTPGHTRVKEHATPVGLWLAQAINYATGGTAYQPGAISPTPDAIDYLMRQATGGVGREIERAQVTASSALTGETLPTYKVPGFGQFVGSAGDDTAVRSKFYRNIEALNQHELEIVGRQRHRGDVMGYLAEHPEARLVESANQLERRIHELQRTKRELLDRGGSKERIRLIEQSITAQMARLNEQVQRMSR